MDDGLRQLRSMEVGLQAASGDQGREGPGANYTKKVQDIGVRPEATLEDNSNIGYVQVQDYLSMRYPDTP